MRVLIGQDEQGEDDGEGGADRQGGRAAGQVQQPQWPRHHGAGERDCEQRGQQRTQ